MARRIIKIDSCKRVKLPKLRNVNNVYVEPCFRILEDNDFRVTENGNFIILETCPESNGGFDYSLDFVFE